jgi:hypothetical protein
MGVKGNHGGGWSSDNVVLSLGRWQNGDAVEWWGSDQGWNELFIAVECGSRAVRRG